MIQSPWLNLARENAFYTLSLVFVSFLPFSEALVSITAGFLLFQAIILTSWNHPSVPHGTLKNLLLICSVFLVYTIGTLFTKDLPFAFYELRKVIFWIILPVAFFISPRLPAERFRKVLLLFCLAVFLASLCGTVKLLFKNYFDISDFRDIILVSHIRYSFQLNLSVILLLWFLGSGTNLPFIGKNRLLLGAIIVWMIYFLVLLKSITGIIAFLGTSFLFFVYLIIRIKNPAGKAASVFLLLALVAVPVIYVNQVRSDFYRSEPLNPEKVDKLTLSGNPYFFNFQSKERENGQWVEAYICETELRKEWNRLSSFKYDSLDARGYPNSETLIRFLTSKGLRKDSAGLSQLSELEIRAVENGYANHIYVDETFSLYPRIYETIWELDHYLRSGNPNNQSLPQRIEYIKASMLLIKKNPWFGIGTGNWKIEFSGAYQEIKSQLNPENQAPSHNQYLNYLVKFGITGFLWIFASLLIPVFREGHRKNLVFWLFLVSIALANFGDANLETHMGLSYFCFFYSLFLWHSPQDIKSSEIL